MEIKFKDLLKEISCDEDVVEQLNNVHLPEREGNKYDEILNFLNNPEDEVNYFALFREFLNFQFQNEDLLEYINIKGKKIILRL